MIEYNYIYGFLNNYGNYINGVAPGTEEWRDVTTNFGKELFQVIKNDEHYMLGKIIKQTSSTYEVKL